MCVCVCVCVCLVHIGVGTGGGGGALGACAPQTFHKLSYKLLTTLCVVQTVSPQSKSFPTPMVHACTYRCKVSLTHNFLTHQCIPHKSTDSCDWASPCNSGVCFSNTTGCPTTGLHRIMTNHTTLTTTPLTPTPLTNDDFQMYYRSLLVTVVLVVLAVATMCLTIGCQGGR